MEKKKLKNCWSIGINYTFAPLLNQKSTLKMKRLVTIIAAAGVFSFVACGPSAEQKAAQQHMQDSLRADSMKKAADMAATMMKAKQDSAMKAQMPKDSTKKDSTKH
jgi:hypothetical protein